MKIVKTFSFDLAHMLDGHDGKCRNLHGHTYKLEVEISGSLAQGGAKDGMVMDFADVKACVKHWVAEPFDHAFVYNRHSERESRLAALLQNWQLKTVAMDKRTTAENMAQHMFCLLRQQGGLNVSAIRLWETPTSYCEYTGANHD
ncbi:6-carboxytetrahydropterin synthase QueD [Paralysiella testudinis]|uniref:6-carboxy-5,6,7,8-tetrahydropterin synthase n=1 Tax=Paralysiella testudinis TaxID=2809020 RepID=A0A892ZKI5_9NEIS|nr:6-carboxytetrahydropterin synthase QueD [Paralysiella testudinis]QRQ82928.1 6-carboxytetrahydropterin synthase QueD [Paralysiella testudinis]